MLKDDSETEILLKFHISVYASLSDACLPVTHFKKLANCVYAGPLKSYKYYVTVGSKLFGSAV